MWSTNGGVAEPDSSREATIIKVEGCEDSVSIRMPTLITVFHDYIDFRDRWHFATRTSDTSYSGISIHKALYTCYYFEERDDSLYGTFACMAKISGPVQYTVFRGVRVYDNR